MYDSRLFTAPKLRAIAEIADDIGNACLQVTDALASYEGAETSDEREDAREDAWAAIGEILVEVDKLREARERLAAGDDLTGSDR